MLKIECPHCQVEFDDDMPRLTDGSSFVCPECEREITITMTWTGPPPKRSTGPGEERAA